MFCKKCGKKIEENHKFCINCGVAFASIGQDKSSASVFDKPQNDYSDIVKKVLGALALIVVIGWGIYASLDDDSINTNNEALTSFDTGNSQTAINQLEQASRDAVTNDTKLNTLKNLAYVYSSEGQNDQALQSFEEALTYTSKDSFDYFLIAGEIALLEGKPNAALISYNKAYALQPNDFQINNALNLFYLDLNEIAPYYVDYPKALQYAQKAYNTSEELIKNSARQNLAIAHYFNENYDQAISLFLYTDVNKEPYIAYWLGWAYAANEDVSNAKLYFQKAVNAGIEVEPEAYDYLY